MGTHKKRGATNVAPLLIHDAANQGGPFWGALP